MAPLRGDSPHFAIVFCNRVCLLLGSNTSRPWAGGVCHGTLFGAWEGTVPRRGHPGPASASSAFVIT
jgi:hypothetical protein